MSTEEEASAPKAARFLTTSQRAEAIALWESGDVTYDVLVKRFGKSKAALRMLFTKNNVKYGSKKAETARAAKEAVNIALTGESSILAGRIRDTKEEHYRMASGIAKLTWKIMADAQNNNVAIGTRINDMKALQAAAQILKIVREERYAVLGLNEEVKEDDSPLPDLVVRELTVEQVRLMHSENETNVGNEFDMTDVPDPFAEDGSAT